MKAYRGAEVKLHVICIPMIDGRDWLAVHSGNFIACEPIG